MSTPKPITGAPRSEPSLIPVEPLAQSLVDAYRLIRRLGKLQEAVGRSRDVNRYARNETAVSEAVDVEDHLYDLIVKAYAAAAGAPADACISARALTFQGRVHPWMLACFGATIAADRVERNHRYTATKRSSSDT